ncbi:MAG: hypothetical protein AABM66_01125 [Actinomycetota bacterium]
MDQLISNDYVLADELEDPEFRERWERTALARSPATQREPPIDRSDDEPSAVTGRPAGRTDENW